MRLPPISTKASRIAGAGLAAIAVFLALSWALRLKDAPVPASGKSGRADAKQPAAETGLDKRHEAMALESELRKKPNHVPILFRLAQLARENGKNTEAVTHFRKIIELEPKNREAHLELGRTLYDIGDVTGALEQTNRILMEKPSDVDALYNVGAIYANSNKMDLARDYWNRAVKSAPNSESGQKAAEGLKRLVQPPANPR
ncbi:MAG: hypothetical protein DMG57_34450 [Acidobacteria bacterium]|nr:MAG: hypothetical protein DMG57_34450 [Acidobacteriota bacterium]